MVALSSCEAEYIALSACVQEVLFLRKLLRVMYDKEDVHMSVQIGVDNQGTIALILAKNPVHQQRSKHLDQRYHFLTDAVSEGVVKLYYLLFNGNIADVLANPVSGRRMAELLCY